MMFVMPERFGPAVELEQHRGDALLRGHHLTLIVRSHGERKELLEFRASFAIVAQVLVRAREYRQGYGGLQAETGLAVVRQGWLGFLQRSLCVALPLESVRQLEPGAGLVAM